jgi:hypothetical protein
MQAASSAITPSGPRESDTVARLQALRRRYLFGMALSFILGLLVVAACHLTVQTIGTQAAPSAVAAQRIKIDAQGIDADLADELISVPGQDYQAVTNYEQRLAAVHRDLIALSRIIPDGAVLQDVNQHLGDYEEATQRARDYHQQHDPSDLAAYRGGLEILQTDLLTPADRLYQSGSSTLQVTYNVWRLALIVALIWVAVWLRSLLQLMSMRAFLRERFR